MARFWKEKKGKGVGKDEEIARTQSFRVFMRTLTASRLLKDEGKVRDGGASLVNSGAIAECATPETSAWSDRAHRPQLHSTYCSVKPKGKLCTKHI